MCLHKTARIYRKSVIFQINVSLKAVPKQISSPGNARLYNRMTVMTTAKAYEFLTFRPSSRYKRGVDRNFVIR